MTAVLIGGPHGLTEAGAAHTEAAHRTGYQVASGRYEETAGYALSVLQAIADGEQPRNGETAAQYAQRHLGRMAADGRIRTGGSQ